jgi:hypothetical protein
MKGTELVRASKVIKDNTSAVRAHLNVVERAREIYLAGMKRLEADYFERIRGATEVLTGEETNETVAPAQSSAVPNGNGEAVGEVVQ